jgi:hypothetical protein
MADSLFLSFLHEQENISVAFFSLMPVSHYAIKSFFQKPVIESGKAQKPDGTKRFHSPNKKCFRNWRQK